MWLNIQIQIQDRERIYASFINETYNEINNKLTLSFEVFITNLIDLFQKERVNYSSVDKFDLYVIIKIPLNYQRFTISLPY